MARAHDDSWILWAIGALILYEEIRPSLERAGEVLKQGGAKLYEATHPAEQAHKDDLPGHQYTREALTDLVIRTGFPDARMAVAIILAESGGVPNARTRSSREDSVGLFQINLKAHPQYTAEEMADPGRNALAALAISKRGTDWRPWSVYKSGAYRRYL